VPLKLVEAAAATVEPVSVAEAKAHCRVDTTADDALLGSMITTARVYVETRTNRQLNTATFQLYMDSFPATIELPRSPLGAVSSIVYYDSLNVSQTLATTEYTVDSRREPATIAPAYGKSWPTTYDIPNAVCITYTAGYGSAASDVPVPIKQAVLMHVAHQYDNRSASDTQDVRAVPLTVDSLCKLYEVPIVA
jgi:uncharacterized phiE125 gp8 family phage protein